MPWAALLPLLMLLPFLLSGGVRYTTGFGFNVSLALCLSATVMAALAAYRFGLPRVPVAAGRLAAPGVLVLALVLVWWTYRLWWTPVQSGMSNTVVGVDAGNHALLYQRFTFFDAGQYEGQVGLYALMHWYRQVLELFTSTTATAATYYGMRFAHYASILTIPLALAVMAYPAVARLEARKHELLTLVGTLPFQMAVLAALIFPVTQYFQAEGFYSQIAGIYPLIMGWLVFGLTENAATRFVVCGVWLVAQRFTYSLNLADMLVALSLVWLFDANAIKPSWLRWGARLFVPVALVVAYVVYTKLYPLRMMVGYFTFPSWPWVLIGQLLLSLALLVARPVLVSFGVEVSDASERLWRYAGLLGLVNGGLTAVYFANDQPFLYYMGKYALYANVLVMIASVGPIATTIAHVVSSDWRWTFSLSSLRLFAGIVAVGALASLAFAQGHLNYRALAKERYGRDRNHALLHSNYEPRADSFITRTLKKHNASFGGYYDSLWARMFMTNALRYVFSVGPDYHYNSAYTRGERMFEEKPGLCLFYLWPSEYYHGGPDTPMKIHIRSLYERRTSCTEYMPRWGPAPLTYCSTCL